MTGRRTRKKSEKEPALEVTWVTAVSTDEFWQRFDSAAELDMEHSIT
jgi:hypothetical protein